VGLKTHGHHGEVGRQGILAEKEAFTSSTAWPETLSSHFQVALNASTCAAEPLSPVLKMNE